MRHVLRRREFVADDWRHLEEPPSAADQGVIVPLPVLRTAAREWQEWRGPLGVRIAPADRVEDLASDLARFALVAIEFPSPSEGRGYSQAQLLRARFGFGGELRALGPAVKRDLIFALARCGFDAFEVAAGEDPQACVRALERYTVAYQSAAANAGLRQRLNA